MPLLDLRIDDALQETWDDFTAYMAKRFTQEIRAVKWDWPREPSPRDIIDTGNLRDSLRISPRQGGELRTEFRWEAPYAPWVHDGAAFKRTDAEGNPRTLTARPWTRPVLRDAATLRRYFALRFRLAMKRRAEQ
jgi:hypothetical protein